MLLDAVAVAVPPEATDQVVGIVDEKHGVGCRSGLARQGANVYGATIPDDQPLVNGEYGAASGTDIFEAAEGETVSTTVDLRYTVQLLEVSLNQFTRITGYDPVARTDGTVGAIRDDLDRLHDATNGEWTSNLDNADFLSDVQPEDITVVAVPDAGGYSEDRSESITWESNQALLAMADIDGNEDYSDPLVPSRHAADVRDYDNNTVDHPAILTAEPSSEIEVTSTGSSSSGIGSSNGGVN